MKEVVVKGHAHSFNTHWYKKVDGVWKFAGLNPDIRWSEYDFERVFESGRSEMGEKEGERAAGIVPVDAAADKLRLEFECCARRGALTCVYRSPATVSGCGRIRRGRVDRRVREVRTSRGWDIGKIQNSANLEQRNVLSSLLPSAWLLFMPPMLNC